MATGADGSMDGMDEAQVNEKVTQTPHPAKFSPVVLGVIRDLIREMDERLDWHHTNILDPFAGVGGIHLLNDGVMMRRTFAVELEPEWAAESAMLGPTWCGDFFEFKPTGTMLDSMSEGHPRRAISMNALMLHPWPVMYDAVVTSPTYGNRMADHHDAKEKCKACNGQGEIYEFEECVKFYTFCYKCNGTGRREHKRLTYKHQLGRDLSSNSSAAMQWGVEYKVFHNRAWRKVSEILRPGGLFILNVKDHIRGGRLIPVSRWHRDNVIKHGFELLEDRHVPVKGMG